MEQAFAASLPQIPAFSFLAWFAFFGTYHSIQALKLPDYALNLHHH